MVWRTNNARTAYAAERSLACDAPLHAGEEPPLASHLTTPRGLYVHHGIYIGNGRVIHYAVLTHGFRPGSVEDIPLEEFARGRGIPVRYTPSRFDRCEVVDRARSRLGESRYRVLTNNCDHFCTWVLRDESCSAQVERLRAVCAAFRSLRGSKFMRSMAFLTRALSPA